MKAGIITITNGENYGNRLQNYAVQEALKDIGLIPETIHKTTNVFNSEDISFIWKLRIKHILHYHITKEEKRILNFYRFTHKYIKKSRFIIDKNVPAELEQEYQYFIAGSDQVWNPYFDYCTKENFLTFTEHDKKIAFSPSIAVTRIPKEREADFRNWISDFRLLSVRESQGAEIIYQLCGRKAEVLCDPTIYLSAQKWRKLEKKVKSIKKPYILTYFLGECPKELRKRIDQMAQNKKREVFCLQTPEHYSIAPDEFLYLVDHADCVFTDSYHGTIFSLIFHTPFWVFTRKENFVDMSSRIDDLLSAFHMKDRLWNSSTDLGIFQIDFTESDRIITQLQKKIYGFLKKIYEGENNAKSD